MPAETPGNTTERKRVRDYVATHTNRKAVYNPGSYASTLVSKMSCDWGWPQGQVFEGFKITVSQPSPPRPGVPPIAYFDFVREVPA